MIQTFRTLRGDFTYAQNELRSNGVETGNKLNRFFYDAAVQLQYPTDVGVTPYVFAGGGAVTFHQVGTSGQDKTKGAGTFGLGLNYTIPETGLGVFAEGKGWLLRRKQPERVVVAVRQDAGRDRMDRRVVVSVPVLTDHLNPLPWRRGHSATCPLPSWRGPSSLSPLPSRGEGDEGERLESLMTSQIATLDIKNAKPTSPTAPAAHAATRYLVPLGRTLFAAIFLMTLPSHFSQAAIGYAAQKGVPLAALAVPLSGIIAFAGGLSILLGYKAKIGAWLLVLFLVPVTLMMHNFWTLTDPMMVQMDQAMFMKNVGLVGGALLIAHFGAGPVSLDARRVS